eukprot:TRINITY_DN9746_c0_g1_i1.p1 TRINITY_DN9746_c0_g1~~TRINITY_DN9746_c0_g1_i1.p1  ORF type:complete len:461 (-),score=88.27 TRINITY_DN9746_c0_g1_i1:182-1564(-)
MTKIVLLGGHHTTHMSKKAAFLFAIRFWFNSLLRSMPITLTVTTVMVMYYAPARLMTPSMLQHHKELIYQVLLCIPQQILIALAYSLCLVGVFGLDLSLKPLGIVCPIFAIFNIAVTIFFPASFEIRSYITLFGVMIEPYIVLSLYSKMNNGQASVKEKNWIGYSLIYDGTIPALRKGWIGFFIVVGLFSFTIEAFLNAPVVMQLAIRTIVFPLLCFVATFYQQLLLVGLSIESMSRRLLVLMCSGQFLQFLGRLMVSNISSGSKSTEFVLLNLSTSVVEFLSRISYMQRYLIYRKIKRALKLGQGRQRAPVYVASNNQDSQAVADAGQNPSLGIFSAHESVSDYAKAMRAKQIVEDVGTEIRIMMLVPVLLYMLHPIYSDTDFQTIPLLEDAIVQIVVQLVFEFVGDVSAVFMEVYYLKIPLEINEEGVMDAHFGVKVCISLVCVFFVHEILLRSTLQG